MFEQVLKQTQTIVVGAMDVLIKFAHGKDVFIYNFVVVIKIHLANFYMMYFDPSSNY
jgi:hypothetical protein